MRRLLSITLLAALLTLAACAQAEPASPTLPPAPPLSGELIIAQGTDGIARLDLASGELTPLFTPGGAGYVASLAVSPDRSLLAMAYAIMEEGATSFGTTGLYTLPLDGSAPPTALLPSSPDVALTYPAWSPDGTYLYFSRVALNDGSTGEPTLSVERIAFPDGQPEAILSDGVWPALSPDGTKLAYLIRGESTDLLGVANADGSDPIQPLDAADFPVVDAHVFSHDGKAILFSAVTEEEEGDEHDSSWLDDLFSLQVAFAHTEISDLWQVAVDGGEPTRLTNLLGLSMYPAIAPDGKYIALLASGNLYVINPDGSGLALIREGIDGTTMEWIAAP